jgi:hypothetical protein
MLIPAGPAPMIIISYMAFRILSAHRLHPSGQEQLMKNGEEFRVLAVSADDKG